MIRSLHLNDGIERKKAIHKIIRGNDADGQENTESQKQHSGKAACKGKQRQEDKKRKIKEQHGNVKAAQGKGRNAHAVLIRRCFHEKSKGALADPCPKTVSPKGKKPEIREKAKEDDGIQHIGPESKEEGYRVDHRQNSNAKKGDKGTAAVSPEERRRCSDVMAFGTELKERDRPFACLGGGCPLGHRGGICRDGGQLPEGCLDPIKPLGKILTQKGILTRKATEDRAVVFFHENRGGDPLGCGVGGRYTVKHRKIGGTAVGRDRLFLGVLMAVDLQNVIAKLTECRLFYPDPKKAGAERCIADQLTCRLAWRQLCPR